MKLLEPITLGSRRARNRIVFGPHETNLARKRAISDRHAAYYRARAEGGAGVIVVEEASVHPRDWPYERAPSVGDARAGWELVASTCQERGALVIAALGHAGGQGNSAYSQAPLWAPSRVPEIATREVPKWMEPEDIEEVIHSFGVAARAAHDCGLDGVEVNAGQYSLVRQFLSGLTNHRGDEWGTDRLLFAKRVLGEVRANAGEGVVGLRLSCDELAPWAGLVPEAAAEVAAALADYVDYVTVVRGSIYTTSAYRPDTHAEPGFNIDLARLVRAALPDRVAVILQGSVVDPGQAEWVVSERIADAVEMTRAQIADAELARKLAAGEADRIRPCIRCNQACQVRDARNPIVSCVGAPSSGHEWEDAAISGVAPLRHDVLVVGGGPAGLECARVASARGHRVVVRERDEAFGGAFRTAARGAGREPLAALVSWLEAECRRNGVELSTGVEVSAEDVESALRSGTRVVLCTGSVRAASSYTADEAATVLSASDALAGAPLPEGPVVVWDPIGGPIGISVAELLSSQGREVTLATPDLIAGNELSRTGDLAPANVRLQAAGVHLAKRALLRHAGAGEIEVEDRFTGERSTLKAAAVVDAGYRLPNDRLWRETGERVARAGDSVAPRSVYEAILEGRRAALSLEAV
ncbi:MAG: mycofactocin system FadH/OYE family oxidoreductase 1 [Acidimicrobiia bacterium]